MYKFSYREKNNLLFIIITGIIFILFHSLYNFNNKENICIKLYISAFYFTSISIGALVFLCIQHISKSGWSVVIHPIIEKISFFIPYGFSIILLVLMLNIMGFINMFSWMKDNNNLSENKKFLLNIPFFLIRSLIYILGFILFYFKIKKASKILNKNINKINNIKNYKNLYRISVYFIIFFSIISTLMSWDWIMSINPNWISTIFGWYILSSFLTIGIGTILIVSIYLKKKGVLPLFNDNHLHDLSKYLFSSNLLWTYFWFCQFLLYWYSNIPEEVYYFIKREKFYNYIHIIILIPNFLIPFFLLMSKKNKTNSKIVLLVSIITLIGHYADIYNLIYPEISNNIKFNILDIGIILTIGGIFIYILLYKLSLNNIKFMDKGNPFFTESVKYKNPHI
ncbi:hypothetical protein [Blattabacterium cuenoti]|uniref:hypothetical protein n=1 Tax=Blattabacterium cuenoti TaxID=1653831 RepID=UPI00163D3D57|nr:hypothetical protein [Blattabacterium cuenoti]